MSNKNEVFEYLIDQLRQQVNKKDVTSFNVSVQISDLDEVKQVIHNLQQHIAGKDDEIRVLKDSLRPQVNNSQCEDLAHEVLSLKNQLRDSSTLVKELYETISELQEDNIKKSEHISHLTGQVKDLTKQLSEATGDVEAYKLIRKGGYISAGKRYVVGEHVPGASVNCRCTQTPVPPEQSGCRKDDTQECEHEWCVETFYGTRVSPMYCRKCGETT